MFDSRNCTCKQFEGWIFFQSSLFLNFLNLSIPSEVTGIRFGLFIGFGYGFEEGTDCFSNFGIIEATFLYWMFVVWYWTLDTLSVLSSSKIGGLILECTSGFEEHDPRDSASISGVKLPFRFRLMVNLGIVMHRNISKYLEHRNISNRAFNSDTIWVLIRTDWKCRLHFVKVENMGWAKLGIRVSIEDS